MMKIATQVALTSGGQSILSAFGAKAQMIKTCEELGELITQLCKRFNESTHTDDAIVDEIADVLIMVYQMKSLFGDDAVESRIVTKLNRTMDFIRHRAKDMEGNKQ